MSESDECACPDCQRQTVTELRRQSAAELICLAAADNALALQLVESLAAEVAASDLGFHQIEEARYRRLSEIVRSHAMR